MVATSLRSWPLRVVGFRPFSDLQPSLPYTFVLRQDSARTVPPADNPFPFTLSLSKPVLSAIAGGSMTAQVFREIGLAVNQK